LRFPALAPERRRKNGDRCFWGATFIDFGVTVVMLLKSNPESFAAKDFVYIAKNRMLRAS
jgi:hypothetical protein